jgi:galactokinase
MAIDRGTDVAFAADVASSPDGSDRLRCESSAFPLPVEIPLDIGFEPRLLRDLEPPWARLASAVVALAAPRHGGQLTVTSDLPVAAGLSSSAAFAVAVALVLGVVPDAPGMARFCQRAEEAAGSAVGLMDPLVSMAGVAGHALLIDFDTLELEPVPLPAGAEFVVVHSGVDRRLARSPYAARRAECDGLSVALHRPLGHIEEADLPGLVDPVLRRRARHVLTECRRVRALAAAFRREDLRGAGQLLVESHRSLAVDFESSTPVVDALVDTLGRRPGVYGARMTGGGFGGCVVALTEPGAIDVAEATWRGAAWLVTASDGARVVADGAG